ncbi:uncharacterized protein [Rutidosis leptorrhynchoides]|uniref:uncharacterized protein n=1 Tax=Rutidosis leptorrhynchoides TaxID=125765 RepID=UPI003A98F785
MKPKVTWHHVIWYPQANPKHAFILWLAKLDRLSTQDKLMKWFPTKSFKCGLCGVCEDSVQHLFFECSFSKNVWKECKKFLLFQGLPDTLNEIIDSLARYPFRNQIWDIINRLTVAAVVYNIWNERNCRFFKDLKRKEMDLVHVIIEGIKLKLTTFVVKGSNAIKIAEKKWDLVLKGSRLQIKSS